MNIIVPDHDRIEIVSDQGRVQIVATRTKPDGTLVLKIEILGKDS